MGRHKSDESRGIPYQVRVNEREDAKLRWLMEQMRADMEKVGAAVSAPNVFRALLNQAAEARGYVPPAAEPEPPPAPLKPRAAPKGGKAARKPK